MSKKSLLVIPLAGGVAFAIAGVGGASSDGHPTSRRIATMPSVHARPAAQHAIASSGTSKLAMKRAAETPPPSGDFIASQPGCIPVADHGGVTRGCIDKKYVYGNDLDWAPVPAGMPGYPVTDRPGGSIVGYGIPGFAFVDKDTALDPAKLGPILECAKGLRDLQKTTTFTQFCADLFATQNFHLPSVVIRG